MGSLLSYYLGCQTILAMRLSNLHVFFTAHTTYPQGVGSLSHWERVRVRGRIGAFYDLSPAAEET
jgi:hypothetical protein